jgi:hypothetical protein
MPPPLVDGLDRCVTTKDTEKPGLAKSSSFWHVIDPD